MTMSGTHTADAMAQIYPIDAALSTHRPVVHGEYRSMALAQRHDLRARLHPRALLGDDEFAAGEVASGLGQQDRDLQREHVLAVEILMQAVVVAGAVLQKQRRRPALARGMATFDELVVLLREPGVDIKRLVPAIG